MSDFIFSARVERLLVLFCAFLFIVMCWVQVWHWYDRRTVNELESMRSDIIEMKGMVEESIKTYEDLRGGTDNAE